MNINNFTYKEKCIFNILTSLKDNHIIDMVSEKNIHEIANWVEDRLSELENQFIYEEIAEYFDLDTNYLKENY